MTIPSETNRSGPYNGNGVTKLFDYDFKIVDASHIQVIRAEDGVETILELDVDYTVHGVGNDDGGQIETTDAPITGQSITNLLDIPFTQEIDLENQGAYYAETVEAGFDLAVLRDQQLSERINRAVVIPPSADPSELQTLVGSILRLSESAENIDTVANIASEVENVSDNMSAVLNVSANVANINTVANIAGEVEDVADNMSAVLAAPGAADAAAASALAASGSASDADADRVQTGLDRIAAAASALAASGSASSAEDERVAAETARSGAETARSGAEAALEAMEDVIAGEGLLLSTNNLSDVASAATAFDNIKQAATDSSPGVVEKATVSEVANATADKFISAEHLESAAAPVALTDAATVAVDWRAAAASYSLVVTANRIIGNPTNGIPGTWRTLEAAASSATERTITFGNQFTGELPEITDLTDTKKYLINIYCVSATEFRAFAAA